MRRVLAVKDADERNAAYQELAAKLQTEVASGFLLHEHAVWGTTPTSRTASRTRWTATSSPPTSPSAADKQT